MSFSPANARLIGENLRFICNHNALLDRMLQNIIPHLTPAWYIAFDALNYDAVMINKVWNRSPTFKNAMIAAVPNAETKYSL